MQAVDQYYTGAIAEIGINHFGKSGIAKQLIAAAAASGCSAVKFQYRNIGHHYVSESHELGDDILKHAIAENYLSPSDIYDLALYAKREFGLRVGTSFFSASDVDDFSDYTQVFDFFKLPSCELLNFSLADSLLKLKRLVFYSLGAHNEKEVQRAIDCYSQRGWIAMHCISNYPVSLMNAKLGYLKYLKRLYPGLEFGYSSHDQDWEVCVLAIGNGVKVIERHITLDKSASGLDHSSSSTPEEFERLNRLLKNSNSILGGDSQRSVNQGELLNRQNLGKSPYALVHKQAGEYFSSEDYELRSPMVGLHPAELGGYLDSPLVSAVQPGEVLSRSKFEKIDPLNIAELAFVQQNRLSIPVRFHDYAAINNRFPDSAYEFHLSYSELAKADAIPPINSNAYHSVHVPDYIGPEQLVDPFSVDKHIRECSLRSLERVYAIADTLQSGTGKPVPVVGSFSKCASTLEKYFEQIQCLIQWSDEKFGVQLLPQWLPPVAWYFGGSVPLSVFNCNESLELIAHKQIPFCLDFSHWLMCVNAGRINLFDFRKVEHLIHHVHLAGADGIDGEGTRFIDCRESELKALRELMGYQCLKVIEVWQAHLDNGRGFVDGIRDLFNIMNQGEN